MSGGVAFVGSLKRSLVMEKLNHRAETIRLTTVKIPSEDLDEILRGEISAKEAYTQALEKFEGTPSNFAIEQIRSEHEQAIDFWKREARDMNLIPETNSGIWGTIVQSFMATSKAIGVEATTRALRKGEEHGLNNYQRMLESTELTRFQKNEIENVFIPRQKRHIKNLDNVLALM